MKARKSSLSQLITQANKLFGTSNQFARIEINDFADRVIFSHSLPLIYLDFVDTLTGSNILKNLHAFEFPKRYAARIDVESSEFLQLKSQIDECFLPHIWSIFDRLGEISPEESNRMTQ